MLTDAMLDAKSYDKSYVSSQITDFECPTPTNLFTIQRLRGYEDD